MPNYPPAEKHDGQMECDFSNRMYNEQISDQIILNGSPFAYFGNMATNRQILVLNSDFQMLKLTLVFRCSSSLFKHKETYTISVKFILYHRPIMHENLLYINDSWLILVMTAYREAKISFILSNLYLAIMVFGCCKILLHPVNSMKFKNFFAGFCHERENDVFIDCPLMCSVIVRCCRNTHYTGKACGMWYSMRQKWCDKLWSTV